MLWMSKKLLVLILSITGFFSGVANAAVNRCSHDVDTGAPVLTNGFTLDLHSTRNSPSKIDSSNVGDLRLDWTHAAYRGAAALTEKRGAPVVTEKTIYTTAGFSVIALDRATGCEHWRYTLPTTFSLSGGDGVRSIYYVNEGRWWRPALIYAGDNYGHLYAINAQTGKKVWARFVGTDWRFHKITAHPQFVPGSSRFDSGTLLVPLSSKEVLSSPLNIFLRCCRSHGLLRALNPYNGFVKWSYHTTQAPHRLQHPAMQGPNGVPLWSSATVDTKRNMVYIGTGQNYTQPYTDNADAIVALDLKTGKQKWVFQATAGDAFNASCNIPVPFNYKCSDADNAPDLDFGASPVLAQRPDGREVIFAGAKNGVLYSLDPDSGELIWKTRLGEGSNLGGIHWGMAVDDAKVYVGVSDAIVNKLDALNFSLIDFSSFISANFIELTPDATPGLYAVDMITGAVVWKQSPSHEWTDPETGGTGIYPDLFSAAPTVSNDLVFAGSLNGMMYAFGTTDGALLWSYDTNIDFVDINQNPGNGGTIDQVGALAAGDSLLINSGYDHFGGENAFQAGPGNALFVLRLK